MRFIQRPIAAIQCAAISYPKTLCLMPYSLRLPFTPCALRPYSSPSAFSIPLSTSRLIIFLNFFSLKDQVIMVAAALIENATASAIQKPADPKTAWKNKNKKVENIIVAIKVPTII